MKHDHHFATGTVLLALVIALGGCARGPIRPIPLEQANTAAWFESGPGIGLADDDKADFDRARELSAARHDAEAVAMHRELAAQGVAESAYELATAYRDGRGVERNPALSVQWLIAAASTPNTRQAHATHQLGRAFLDGDGVPRDVELARRLLDHAKDQQYSGSAVELAKIHAQGLGVRENLAQAERLALEGVRDDDISSHLWLLRAYRADGVLGSQPQRASALARDAIALLHERVESHDDPRAMRDLAIIHHQGLGVPQNRELALDWLHRAAEAGYPEYLVEVGEDLLRGSDGFAHDPERAVYILNSAVQRYGHPEAVTLMASAYRDGIGVELDIERAHAMYRHAVAMGSMQAHRDYGRMLAASGDPAAVQRGAALLDKAAAHDMPLAWAALGELHVTQGFAGADPAKGVALLERAHDAGIASATAALGHAYLDGRGAARDTERAQALLLAAAQAGHVGAMGTLGREYLDGTRLARRPDDARLWLERAAEAGSQSAHRKLGIALLRGEIAGDARRGESIVTGLANAGDTFAMMELGRAYRDGPAVARDPLASRRWFERAHAAGETDAAPSLASMIYAEATRGGVPDPARLKEAVRLGHEGAMALLGRWYLEGEYGLYPPQAGVTLLSRAAAAGNSDAAATLGSALLHGTGKLQQDVSGGLRLLAQAAAAGERTAQRELGYALLTGNAAGRDPRRGLALLEQAAQAYDPHAMQLLGKLYLQGHPGIARSPERAERWLRQAVQEDDVSSMTTLGAAYLENAHFKGRTDEGLRLLREAVQHGDDTALLRLGEFYLYGGHGVPPRPKEGEALLQRAVANGHPGAMGALGRAYLNGDLGPSRQDDGARLLLSAARAGHPTAQYALAEAYLKSQGLAATNREYAQTWLQSMVAGDTEIAVRTLTQMLRETNVRIPEPESGPGQPARSRSNREKSNEPG